MDADRETAGNYLADGLALSEAQRLDWLRLIRSENVGAVTFRELVNHYGGAGAALEALPQLSLRGGGGRAIRICSLAQAEAELTRTRRYGANLVAPGERGYPPWLAAVDAPPPLLYVKGRLEQMANPVVAIVGARNGSAIGQKFARQLANDLGAEGFIIASGLARGIDTAAHTAALERGTAAVMAGGIDVIYPPENAKLHAAIGERGLLISERDMGFQPRGPDFPRRNRLISGMSAGVIVVEAAKRSGSLITARMAGEQGREVFAVPGNPLDPRAAGTNGLLKDGANIVTCAEDVISVLAPILGRGETAMSGRFSQDEPAGGMFLAPEPSGSERETVISALGFSPVDIDEIIRTTGLGVRAVHIVLLELDLAGRIERHGSQLVSLRDTVSDLDG